MRVKTIITITSAELDEKQEKINKEIFNSPALLEQVKETLKEITEKVYNTEEKGETVEIEFKKETNQCNNRCEKCNGGLVETGECWVNSDGFEFPVYKCKSCGKER